MLLRLMTLPLAALALSAADPNLERADAKLDRISEGMARPGEEILFTTPEINAWARDVVPKAVPQGVRNPRIELGNGTATGSAIVDFLKMEQARGKSFGVLTSKLLEGERPLGVSVRLESNAGKCTVYLTRVELSGITIEGSVLDILIKTFFMPLYPDAKIGEPFELDDNIDRIELRPDGVHVTMKK